MVPEIIQNGVMVVMNDRGWATHCLLSNEFADKRVQLIVVFDPHKLVDDIASPHGDYRGNRRDLETGASRYNEKTADTLHKQHSSNNKAEI